MIGLEVPIVDAAGEALRNAPNVGALAQRGALVWRSVGGEKLASTPLNRAGDVGCSDGGSMGSGRAGTVLPAVLGLVRVVGDTDPPHPDPGRSGFISFSWRERVRFVLLDREPYEAVVLVFSLLCQHQLEHKRGLQDPDREIEREVQVQRANSQTPGCVDPCQTKVAPRVAPQNAKIPKETRPEREN
jgi:hypothetical protein